MKYNRDLRRGFNDVLNLGEQMLADAEFFRERWRDWASLKATEPVPVPVLWIHYAGRSLTAAQWPLLLARARSLNIDPEAPLAPRRCPERQRGYTLLHWAVDRGSPTAVEKLLQWGFDPTVAADDVTPLEMAMADDYTECVDLLRAALARHAARAVLAAATSAVARP